MTIYDEQKDHVDIFMSLMLGGQNIAFWKRASYAYQNEFRFVISAANLNDEHLELDIGNIKDISAIMKTSSILNALVIKNYIFPIMMFFCGIDNDEILINYLPN